MLDDVKFYYIHKDPVISARSLPDDVLIKTVMDVAITLSITFSRNCNPTERASNNMGLLYQMKSEAMLPIPWVSANKANYTWLLEYFKALLNEHKHRFDTVHCSEQILGIVSNVPNHIGSNLSDSKFTAPPFTGRVKFLVNDVNKPIPAATQPKQWYQVATNLYSSVNSYRNYLFSKIQESNYVEYTRRAAPVWVLRGSNRVVYDMNNVRT